jgi:hypothetical protein
MASSDMSTIGACVHTTQALSLSIRRIPFAGAQPSVGACTRLEAFRDKLSTSAPSPLRARRSRLPPFLGNRHQVNTVTGWPVAAFSRWKVMDRWPAARNQRCGQWRQARYENTHGCISHGKTDQ